MSDWNYGSGLDLTRPEDVRAVDTELRAIEKRLTTLLKNGPWALPDEILEITTPTPRGLADIPRALHHITAVRRQLAAGYVGLR